MGARGNVVNQPRIEPVSVLDLDGTNAVVDATPAGLLSHPGVIQGRSGIATRVLGHRPSDVDFLNASGTGPMDGLMIVDGSTSLLWIRLRGVWQPIAAGGPVVGVVTKSVSYTVQPTDAIGVILCAASGITITLPAPASVPMGRIYAITNTAASGNVTVNAVAGTVNGFASVSVEALYSTMRFVSDGSNWYSA